MNNVAKKGRGRPKGAKSTIEVSLADLLAKVGEDKNTTIVVGRMWYTQGQQKSKSSVISNLSAPASEQDGDSIPPEIRKQIEEESAIEFSITT